MANKKFSMTFKNCYIDTEERTLTEMQKDMAVEYDLDNVLKELEGKNLSISFVETREIVPSELGDE